MPLLQELICQYDKCQGARVCRYDMNRLTGLRVHFGIDSRNPQRRSDGVYSVPSNSVKSTKSLEVSSSTLIRAGFHKFTRLCYSPFGVLLEPGRWEDKLANGDLVISAENGLWMSAWSNGSSASDYADGWALKKPFFFFLEKSIWCIRYLRT